MVQIRSLQNYEKQMLVLDSFVTFIDKDLVEDITVYPSFFKRQVLMVKFLSRVLLETFCQVNLSEKGNLLTSTVLKKITISPGILIISF